MARALLEQFERALELNPQVSGAHRGMAVLLMRRGDCVDALAWLEEEQKIDDSEPLRAEINDCRLQVVNKAARAGESRSENVHLLTFDYPDSKGTRKLQQ